jgi:hypothetical protein
MLTGRRQAARLRAERVDAAAHRAKQVVERVLWDFDYRWRKSQRLRLDHHWLLHTDESWGQGGRLRVQAVSATDERGGPQKVMQTAHDDQVLVRGPPKDKIWGLQKQAWCPQREARIDYSGWLERVEIRLTDDGGRVTTPACGD